VDPRTVTRREVLALGAVAEEDGRRDWDGGGQHAAGDAKRCLCGCLHVQAAVAEANRCERERPACFGRRVTW
jgi:hypothetical protein